MYIGAMQRGSERSTLLQRRSELSAGSALLRSAKCYVEIEQKREEDDAAMKLALEEALALFVKHGDQRLAATACSDLAEFHLDRNDLPHALRPGGDTVRIRLLRRRPGGPAAVARRHCCRRRGRRRLPRRSHSAER